jgi:hypothetical protein
MKKMLLSLFSVAVFLFIMPETFSQRADIRKVVIKWQDEKPQGFIEVLNGKLESITLNKGSGKTDGNRFRFNNTGENILFVSVQDTKVAYGSKSTVISVNTGTHSFSFFLRDVT